MHRERGRDRVASHRRVTVRATETPKYSRKVRDNEQEQESQYTKLYVARRTYTHTLSHMLVHAFELHIHRLAG